MARDCSFAGVEFDAEQVGDLARRGQGRVATLAERLSVGGQRRVRQLLGHEAPTLTFTIELDKADFPTLLGLVGTTGTLVVLGDAARPGWLLTAIPGDGVTIDDIHDLVFCQATWVGP